MWNELERSFHKIVLREANFEMGAKVVKFAFKNRTISIAVAMFMYDSWHGSNDIWKRVWFQILLYFGGNSEHLALLIMLQVQIYHVKRNNLQAHQNCIISIISLSGSNGRNSRRP